MKGVYTAPSYENSKVLGHGSHSVTCNYTNASFYLVGVHQIAFPQTEVANINCSVLLIYLPRKDERLSRPGWLTYSGRFTHVNGHPSAAGRAQDRERSPVKDRHPTAVPRNQPKAALMHSIARKNLFLMRRCCRVDGRGGDWRWS